MLAVENFGELTKLAFGEKNFGKWTQYPIGEYNIGESSKHLNNFPRTSGSVNFRKSIHKLLHNKYVGAPHFRSI